MKKSDSKNTATPAKKNSPFFSKDSGQSFFGTKNKSFFKNNANSPNIQRKVTIGKVNDKYEQEADATADKVVHRLAAPEKISGKQPGIQAKSISTAITPFIQSKCTDCEKEEKLQKKEEQNSEELKELHRKPIFESNAEPPDDEQKLQTKSETTYSAPASPSVESTLTSSKGSGNPLPEGTRTQMESYFDADFSNVRIHNDSSAVQMNKDLHAHAFTYGSDIYFNSGKYEASSKEGSHLLAHELTHVVQQDGSSIQHKKQTENVESKYLMTGNHQVQGAWYNFDIPFTDYQFDPSIEGVKTAGNLAVGKVKEGATWVKDRAVDAFEWVYNQIRDLVNAGIEWLTDKFNDIKEFASTVFDKIKNTLGNIFTRITSPISLITGALGNMNADLLLTAWNALNAGANAVWQTIKTVVDGLLNIGSGIWNTVSGYVTSLFDTIGSIINSRVFGFLPDFLQTKARSLYNRIRDFWESIRVFWNDFWKRFTSFIHNLLTSIESFVKRIISFAINALITVVKKLKEAYDLVQLIAKDPEAVIRPIIDKIAGKIHAEAPGKAREVAQQKMNEAFSNGQASASVGGIIQRAPEDEIERSTASRNEINDALKKNFSEQWSKLDIKTMLWETFVNMFWPPATIRAIGQEFYELWNTDWANAINSLFLPRNIFDDFSGFFHDVWTNFLILLDFPLALWRRLNSILMLLMVYVTIILVIVGAIGGAGVGALAGLKLALVIGEALFMSFIMAEGATVLKALIDLYTARQTKEEKDRDYLQIAASVIGIGIAFALYVIFLILGSLASRVVARIKAGKAPAIKPVDPVKTDPVKTDPVKTDPVKTDPVTTDPVTTDPVTTDPVTTDPVTTDPVKTDPVKPDPVNTDPLKTDLPKTDPLKTEPPKTDPLKTEPTKTEVPKPIPKSWDKFDPQFNEEFRTKLKEVRGNEDLTPNPGLRGGEGQLFIGKNPLAALKRWFKTRIVDLAESIRLLKEAKSAVKDNPKLNKDLEVIDIEKAGNDSAMRDFDPDSIPLKDAIGDPEVAAARQRLIDGLEGTKKPILQNILGKLKRNSANVHWSPTKKKILIIDMQ